MLAISFSVNTDSFNLIYFAIFLQIFYKYSLKSPVLEIFVSVNTDISNEIIIIGILECFQKPIHSHHIVIRSGIVFALT